MDDFFQVQNKYSTYFGETREVMSKLSDKYKNKVNLIIADLPYGKTKNHWDNLIPMNDFILNKKGRVTYKETFLLEKYKNGVSYGDALTEWNDRKQRGLWWYYMSLLKPNGAIILFGQTHFSSYLIQSNKKNFRYDITWEKTTPSGYLNAKKMPLRSHEDMLIFYEKLPTYNPQKTDGHPRKVSLIRHKKNVKRSTSYGHHEDYDYDTTERHPKSVWTFKTDKQKIALHPTQKPVKLLEKLIKSYSNEGDIILDNVMGSASCGIACMNTDRFFIGIEGDETMFMTANDRLSYHYFKYFDPDNFDLNEHLDDYQDVAPDFIKQKNNTEND